MLKTEPAEQLYPESDEQQADLDTLIREIEQPVRNTSTNRLASKSREASLRRFRQARSGHVPMEAAEFLRTAYTILGETERSKQRIYQEIGQAGRATLRTFAGQEEIEAAVCDDREKANKAIRNFAKTKLDAGIVVPGRRHPLAGRATYAGGTMPSPYLFSSLMGSYTAPGDTVWEAGPAMVPAAAYAAQVLGRHHALIAMPSERQPGPWARLGKPRQAALVVVPLPLAVDPYSLYQHYQVLALGEETPWAIDNDPEEHPEFALGLDRYMRVVELRLRLLRAQVENPLFAVVTPDRLGLPRAIDKRVVGLRWERVAKHWAYEDPTCAHYGDGSPFGGFAVGIWRPR